MGNMAHVYTQCQFRDFEEKEKEQSVLTSLLHCVEMTADDRLG